MPDKTVIVNGVIKNNGLCPQIFYSWSLKCSHKLLLIDWKFVPVLLSILGDHKHFRNYCILDAEQPTRLTLVVLHGQQCPETLFRM